jgi:predicted permease
MGLPLALLTFGSEGLALAAGFASIVIVSHFTPNSATSSANYSLKKLLLIPVLLALIASLFILFYKIEMPSFINSFAKIL